MMTDLADLAILAKFVQIRLISQNYANDFGCWRIWRFLAVPLHARFSNGNFTLPAIEMPVPL